MRVLVADAIAADGIDLLSDQLSVDVRTGLQEDALIDIIGNYDALIVRSQTQVTARVLAAAQNLQVVGRAGVGIDNIDTDAATERGILVVNAPDGNTVAAAEHTIALMMSLARHIPQADCSLHARQWERKRFLGVEVSGKTLGIVGMGRIGHEVARRGRGLNMNVVAFDPYVSHAHAERLGVTLCTLEELLRQADFVTLHVPLTQATRGLIGERELGWMKPTARVINCSRGGVIDEQALHAAIQSGQIAGAALDVFAQEPPFDSPLLSHPQVVVTPHLGASTAEAQVAVAVDVARQVLDVLNGRPAAHPINAPFIPPETQSQLLPFCELAEKLGAAAAQLVSTRLNHLRITYAGHLAEMDTDLLRALILKGLLQDVSEARITLVNASLLARTRGLTVTEEKTAKTDHFSNLITLTFTDNDRERVLSGTMVRQQPTVVRIDRYWLDFALVGYQLLIYHRDRPGLIGEVGRVTGQADINIAAMGVGRLQARGEALMALTLDEYAPPEILDRIEALQDVYHTELLTLNE